MAGPRAMQSLRETEPGWFAAGNVKSGARSPSFSVEDSDSPMRGG